MEFPNKKLKRFDELKCIACQEISATQKRKVVLTFILLNGGESRKFNRKLPLDSATSLQHNGSVGFKRAQRLYFKKV